MKKKKKDSFGTTKSLSIELKIFLDIFTDSFSNFWHCFDELSSVDLGGFSSILHSP